MRLSVYLRCLQRLKANGIRTVSSEALARVAGVKPTQLRKDLAYFGQFGTRGLGYDVRRCERLPTCSARTACSRLFWWAWETWGWRCFPIVDLNRRDLKSWRLLTRTLIRNASGANTFPFRFMAWRNWRRRCPGSKVSVSRLRCLWRPRRKWPIPWRKSALQEFDFCPAGVARSPEVMVNNVNLAIELENLSYFVQR